MIGTLLNVTGTSVAEQCRFDTVKVQVPTSYFPSYGSGSGSSRKFKRKKKNFYSDLYLNWMETG
jgi:hypothetical protein